MNYMHRTGGLIGGGRANDLNGEQCHKEKFADESIISEDEIAHDSIGERDCITGSVEMRPGTPTPTQPESDRADSFDQLLEDEDVSLRVKDHRAHGQSGSHAGDDENSVLMDVEERSSVGVRSSSKSQYSLLPPGYDDSESAGSSVGSPRERMRCVVYDFTEEMDELMAASNLLVSKAGPGTIVEANTRGLPILLSSYMPGQEEGNVSYVVDKMMGTYCDDPATIGLIATQWLTNEKYQTKMRNMSVRSLRMANPRASLEIAADLAGFLKLSPVRRVYPAERREDDEE